MTTYGSSFYDIIRAGSQASAAAVVPLVHAAFAPETVVDVGCGEGWWAKAFEDLGARVLGIDGHDGAAAVVDYRQHDLAQPLNVDLGGFNRCDLAVSLEVAEHLPPQRASGFVDDLCSLAPVVLFSAAVPGQGGHGHVNEQWPGYWAHRFGANGYAVSGALRFAIWENDQIENWYRMNLLVAADKDHQPPELFETPLAYPLALVHPVLWGFHRGVPAQ